MSDFQDQVKILGTAGTPIITLDAGDGRISVGGRFGPHVAAEGDHSVGANGALNLLSQIGEVVVILSGDGWIVLREPAKPGVPIGHEAIGLNTADSSLKLGVHGKHRVRLVGASGDLWLGGNGVNGDIMIFDENGDNATAAGATIRLNGKDGDIVLQNADCAEDFDVAPSALVEPGAVVSLDEDGRLRPTDKPYDTRVAGVISGAGDCKPGLVLDRTATCHDRRPVALVGKVYCKVDADYAPIQIGDLLTTSSTVGHAMKADDPRRAFGAVIGKAMRPLNTGRGLIPILIALQ